MVVVRCTVRVKMAVEMCEREMEERRAREREWGREKWSERKKIGEMRKEQEVGGRVRESERGRKMTKNEKK